MGLDWRMIVALLTSFIAKENAVATLGVLYASGKQGLAEILAATVSPAGGLAFLVTTMLFIPCAATFAAMRQESGWKWALLGMVLLLVVSLTAGVAVYQVAHWAGL